MATEAILQQVAERGYATVLKKTESSVLRLATALGVPMAEERDPRVYRPISPVTQDMAKPNTLSSRYGTGAFPFHTDTAYWLQPARFLLLHCVNPGAGGRPTLLIDVSRWRLSREEESVLTRGLWIAGDRRPFLTQVMNAAPAGRHIRYDSDCMRPIGPSGELASALLRRKLRTSCPIQVAWAKGLLLIIDNRRILHARGKTEEPDPDRLLGRVLVGERP